MCRSILSFPAERSRLQSFFLFRQPEYRIFRALHRLCTRVFMSNVWAFPVFSRRSVTLTDILALRINVEFSASWPIRATLSMHHSAVHTESTRLFARPLYVLSRSHVRYGLSLRRIDSLVNSYFFFICTRALRVSVSVIRRPPLCSAPCAIHAPLICTYYAIYLYIYPPRLSS